MTAAAAEPMPEITDRNWRTYAACRERDPEDFFPEALREQRIVARYCHMNCDAEVRARCLQNAIAKELRFGVYGGTTERERAKLMKKPTDAQS